MPETIIRGTKRFYQVLNPNEKATIVLIHGHPFDHTMWLYQFEALKDFRLVLPDLRGYGQSEIGTGDIYIEEQALDTALLLDNLGIEHVHLIGLSMGGQIIVEFARLFPYRTLSLIICDSNPAGEDDDAFNRRLQLAQSIQQFGMKKHTDDTIEKYVHPGTKSNNPAVFQHLHKMMSETTTQGAAASHRGRARRRNNFDYLKDIAVPVLVLVGDSDAFTTVEEMKQIADEIKDAKLVVIPDAGHMPNMEQPDAFNEAILQFYNGQTSSTKQVSSSHQLQNLNN